MWALLRWTIVAATLGATGKIYFDFVWTAALADVLFIWLLFNACVKMVASNRAQTSAPKLSFMLLLCAIAVAQSFNSGLHDGVTALAGYRSTGLYVAALLLPCVLNMEETHFRKLGKLLILLGVISALNAIRQYLLPLHAEIVYANRSGGAAKLYGDAIQGGSNTFRPFSTFVTSVHLVLFLTLCAFLSAFSDLRMKRKIASTLIIAAGILATLSRTAYVSVFVGIVEIMLIAALARPATIVKSVSIFALSLLLAAAAVASNPLLGARLATLNDINDVSSFQSRLLLWGHRLVEIVNHPWGFGTGSAAWAFKDTLDHGADSNYLKFFLEFGWIGGALYLVFLLWLLARVVAVQFSIFKLRSAWKVTPWKRSVALSMCAFVIANLVQMVSNQSLEASPNNLLFWFSSGLIFSNAAGAGHHRIRVPGTIPTMLAPSQSPSK